MTADNIEHTSLLTKSSANLNMTEFSLATLLNVKIKLGVTGAELSK